MIVYTGLFHLFSVSSTFLEANNTEERCVVSVHLRRASVDSALDFVDDRQKFTDLPRAFIVELTLRGPWLNVGGEN